MKTLHLRDPRYQQFPRKGSQRCMEMTRQHNKDEHET